MIFDRVNVGILVIGAASHALIDANPRWCSMFGYTHDEMVTLDIAALSSDGTHLDVSSETVPRFWHCRTKEGQLFWTEIAVQSASFGGDDVFLLSAQDVSTQHRVTEDLAYYDRIVHAITVAIADLVAGNSLPNLMGDALKAVGEALDVDRLMVFEGNAIDRPMASAISFFWNRSDDLPPFAAGLTDVEDRKELAAWYEPLSMGSTVISYAGVATGFVAKMMNEMGTRSILMVPIQVDGSYWGHIGVDSCRTPRAWARREIDAVGIFARVVGSLMMRRRAQAALAASEEKFRTVSDTVLDAIIMVDAAGAVAYWNHAAEQMLGYSAAEMAGISIVERLTPPRYRRDVRRAIAALGTTGDIPSFGRLIEGAAVTKSGTEIAIELSANFFTLGAKRFAVGVLRDVTRRKSAEAAIESMASHDDLTGLPNRRFFIEALDRAIAASKTTGEALAVFYLDLDFFKDVNDTLGHPLGDQLLQAVAERLRTSMRESDIIARFGGDEFAAIGADIHSAVDMASMASKIVRALGMPFTIADHVIQSGASLGVAVYDADSPDPESLLAHADVALYRAKADQRGTYRFYSKTMEVAVRARVTINAELNAAIAAREFFVVYQPQVNVDTGTIAGLEALVRWNHPTRGLLGPDAFIFAAERSGIIVALGRFVKREACLQMRRWQDAGIAPPLVSVNVSGVQFKAPRLLIDGIAAILAEADIAASQLELELTESVLMEASLDHNAALLELRSMGLRIAIDDFGTGYSSLDYLRRFRVDRIKVPGSFITDVCSDHSVAAIVRATIGLARELDIELVVEGVETIDQLTLLKQWGCNIVQGYYFSRPLDVVETTRLLRIGTVTPAG